MTQLGYGPLQRIDGPPPIAPQYGLLQAAHAPAQGVRIVPDVDDRGVERWLNGVEVYPYPPDPAGTFDTCATGTDAQAKDAGDTIATPRFGAMTVFLPETCTSYRVWDQDEFKARAVAVLTAVEGAAVENEFMTGTRLLLNPHLSDGQGTFPNLDAVTTIVNGLALLEGEIAKSGRLGLIHLSPMAATMLGQYYLVNYDSKTGVLRTTNGSVVIPGTGYVTGATPSGHAAPAAGDQEWMYASGPIDIRRTEIFTTPDQVFQALDRVTNTITYRAERHYLVDFDQTVQAAVLVDRCLGSCEEIT